MPAVQVRNAALATGTNVTGLNASVACSVAFWVKPFSANGLVTGDVWRHTSTASVARDGYAVYFQNSTIVAHLCGSSASSSASIAGSVTQLRRGEWQHYAVVFDDSTNEVRFFRNGSLIGATTASTDMTSNASVTTEVCGSPFQQLLDAFVFDVQVFPDVVLDAAEVAAVMNPAYQHRSVKGRYYGPNATQYGNSATIRDESGNGNHLTGPASNANCQSAAEPPYRPTAG